MTTRRKLSTALSRCVLTLAVSAAAALVALGGVAVASPDQERGAQRVPRIVTQWASAWNDASPERMAALFTEDGTYEDLAFGALFQGREGVAEWVTITNRGIPDAHIEVTDAFRSGNRIAVRWVFSGTIAGAPQPFSVRATTIMELDGGKIRSDQDYYNLADVLRQSGLPADTTFGAPPA